MKKINWVIGTYRVGITLGVSSVIWLQTTFISKDRFTEYNLAHDRLEASEVLRLENSIADTKAAINRIETKVDTLLRERRAGLKVHEVNDISR